MHPTNGDATKRGILKERRPHIKRNGLGASTSPEAFFASPDTKAWVCFSRRFDLPEKVKTLNVACLESGGVIGEPLELAEGICRPCSQDDLFNMTMPQLGTVCRLSVS